MKVLTGIAVLAATLALTGCASHAPMEGDAKMMKKDDAAMMKKDDGAMMKKDAGMMKKGAGCHNHSANSMTKSMEHCHKSPSADHSHKYGG